VNHQKIVVRRLVGKEGRRKWALIPRPNSDPLGLRGGKKEKKTLHSRVTKLERAALNCVFGYKGKRESSPSGREGDSQLNQFP